MHRLKFRRGIAAAIVALCAFMVLGAASCGGDDKSKNARAEESAGDKAIDKEIAGQPAHTCENCPTRATINFWIDTWNAPGQLAFTYIRGTDPNDVGYYVLNGPPVSMCAALTQTWTYEQIDGGSNTVDHQVPRRSIDGVFYSGGQCASYYGKDASTGAYIEFSVGQGQNYFLSTQPLPKLGAKALGPTDASQVACSGDRASNLKAKRPDCTVKG